jgi:hypothetical protein
VDNRGAKDHQRDRRRRVHETPPSRPSQCATWARGRAPSKRHQDSTQRLALLNSSLASQAGRTFGSHGYSNPV